MYYQLLTKLMHYQIDSVFISVGESNEDTSIFLTINGHDDIDVKIITGVVLICPRRYFGDTLWQYKIELTWCSIGPRHCYGKICHSLE